MPLDTGLYVHIPFCLQKCAYCDFLSFQGTDAEKDIYKNALLAELKGLKSLASERRFSTVYIGGGTPTCFGTDALKELLFTITNSFSIEKNAEITVEANPETVDFSLLKMLKSEGVNRVSLGVQSMDDTILQKIGRVHNAHKVLECYAALRLAGFENINYDLIFALPDQSEKQFYESLTDLLKLSPPHLSLYSLQLEAGTPLFEQQNHFTFVDEDTERRMYHEARRILKENGLLQYEISNFAKPGFESRHNTRYWDCGEYIGAGLGASSYFNGVRYKNPESMAEYIEFSQNFRPLYAENPKLTSEEQQSEFAFLGLRKTDGIAFSAFREKFGADFKTVFHNAVEKHLKNGLLIEENGRLFLSERGIDLANQVMQDFV